ncbi:P-loop containing nucleoside triphosphate hydrolase protein [Biscogniauxia mediterranea]|nr:P-loop containing nucleoside triphosphate hydrolase protein [Biscogniauxia mediterranea]
MVTDMTTINEPPHFNPQVRRSFFFSSRLTIMYLGKRTVADLYRRFLVRCRVWPDLREDEDNSYSTTGYLLQTRDDINGFELTIKVNYAGMFILIDAADHIDEDMRGRLLGVLETHADKIVVVLTGTVEGMTTFLGSKPSGRWQFSRRLELKDYDDEELYRILLGLIRRNSLTVDGEDSRYALIAAKRVGRGRDSAGYGNVHDLVTSFQKMLDRQAVRLEKEWLERPHQDIDHAGDQGDQAAKIKGGDDERSERLADNIPNSNVVETKLSNQNDGMTESNENGSSNPKDPENRAEQNVKHQSDKSDRMPSCSDNGAKELHQEDEDNEGTKSNPELDKETKQDGNDTNPGQRVLTMEDIIGPEPIDIRTQSTAWKELEKMVGLEDVKGAIGELLVRAKANYRRELRGQDPLKTTLNRVFLGPPGTGKTTVARLYGQILADMNVLTTHDVVIKTPADFIGQYIGESETKTSSILDSTLGKVLIIDDAHMFYNGNKEGTSEADEYRLGCIDALVAKIHNRPGEDRCVILIGYPDRMEVMFQNVNPGLQRRFPLEEAFRFENYSDELLNQILRLKMAQEDIKADQPAMDVAAEVLRRARDRPNFGNGGDVDNLLNQAKIRFRERKSKEKKERKSKTSGKEAEGMAHGGGGGGYQAAQDASLDIEAGNRFLLDDHDDDDDGTAKVILEREDFDPEWNRGASASEKCQALFKGLIGFEGIIGRFQGFQKTARNMRLCNKDPKESIPFTYVFKGPPGTGKTHTARILGQIFYDMGFLSTSEVVECSASHLIGRYMGHTAPKVLSLFRAALGKVLFIDEAYRLGGGSVRGLRQGGSFEDEAVGELVDCMTKPEFHRKMIVVLAGYDRDMDALMKVNAGLQGRLATEIVFPPMSAVRCREHLYNLLRDKDIEVSDDEPVTNDMKEKVLRLFDKLGMTAGWANGRDIQTLAATITERVYRSANEILEEEAEAAESEHKQKQKTMKNEGRGVSRAKFSISTRDLIEFLKDLLRQRIKRGRPT